jgi:hypothetical protein
MSSHTTLDELSTSSKIKNRVINDELVDAAILKKELSYGEHE